MPPLLEVGQVAPWYKARVATIEPLWCVYRRPFGQVVWIQRCTFSLAQYQQALEQHGQDVAERWAHLFHMTARLKRSGRDWAQQLIDQADLERFVQFEQRNGQFIVATDEHVALLEAEWAWIKSR